jgi:hypothetical protein
MRQSGIVEPKSVEETITAERSDLGVKADNDHDSDNDEEDPNILHPRKPSHIEFDRSTLKAEELDVLKRLGYVGREDDNTIRFAGDETVSEPKDDEVVVFRSFFWVGLRFPMYEMIAEVLERFEIYLHQLTPNTIVRLSVYIWSLRSQVLSAKAEGFCRIHELHYQTKARSPDNLHKIFGCYNFVYRKDTKAPMLGYQTKWSTRWTNEWFYMKTDTKGGDKFKNIVVSPLVLNFGLTQPICNMSIKSPAQVAQVSFSTVIEHISTRDLVQQYLANKVFPTLDGSL